jgi:hypothetical protein
MRVHSTGLGKTEMICEIASLRRQKGHLIVQLKATEPVVWQIRAAITYRDVVRLVKIGIFTIILYLFTGWRTLRGTPPHPGDF